jgi:hypothetical protein
MTVIFPFQLYLGFVSEWSLQCIFSDSTLERFLSFKMSFTYSAHSIFFNWITKNVVIIYNLSNICHRINIMVLSICDFVDPFFLTPPLLRPKFSLSSPLIFAAYYTSVGGQISLACITPGQFIVMQEYSLIYRRFRSRCEGRCKSL